MDASCRRCTTVTPVLGTRRLVRKKSFWLMQKYGVRNSFSLSDALKMMMKAVPSWKALPAFAALHHERRRSVGETVVRMDARNARVTVNEMFARPNMNYIVGPIRIPVAAKPGRSAPVSDTGWPASTTRAAKSRRRSRGAVRAKRPGFLSRVLEESRGDAQENQRRMVPHRRPREARRGRRFLVQGRSDTCQERRDAASSLGIENCLVKHPALRTARGGQPRSERTHVVKAFIVLTRDTRLRRRWSRAAAAQCAAARALRVSEEIEFIDSLPIPRPASAAAGAAAARRNGRNGSVDPQRAIAYARR